MASENVIDTLQIEIESISKGATAALASTVKALKGLDALGNGTGINNLYRSLKKLENVSLSKLSKQLSTIFEAAKKPLEIKAKITPINAPQAGVTQNVSSDANTTGIKQLSEKISKANEQIGANAADAAQSFTPLQSAINNTKSVLENYKQAAAEAFLAKDPQGMQFFSERIAELKDKLKGLSGQAVVVKSAIHEITPPTPEIVKFGRELERLGVQSKKSATGLSKIVDAFKRIAFYRAIRVVLKEIASAFREGMQNFVQYSEKADATMSSLMNTGQQLKNTLGVTFVSLLTALEPLITTLANGVIKITDGINALMASMSGEEYFSRAKKGADSYADSLKKVNNQLFSFDKFESIGAANPMADMFEDVSVDLELGNLNIDADNLKRAFEGLKDTLAEFGGLIASIMPNILSIAAAVTPAIAGITSAFAPAIKGIISFVSWVITGLDKIGALVPILAAVGTALLTMKFLKAKDDAAQFNMAIDNQKIQANLAKMELDRLKQSTDSKSDADVKAAQRAYNHETAMLKQMQTTRVLNTAMAGLQAVMGGTALGATIGDLIANWGEMSTSQKISQISTIALTAAMTALAIANVAAQSGLGAMVAVPLAVVTIGAGIASAVAAAKSAAKYEHGGIVGGSSFAGDNVIARVNSGEMILNKQQQANLWDMANGQGRNGDTNGGMGDNPSFNLTVVYQDENGRERARRDIPNLVAEINRAGGLRRAGFNG